MLRLQLRKDNAYPTKLGYILAVLLTFIGSISVVLSGLCVIRGADFHTYVMPYAALPLTVALSALCLGTAAILAYPASFTDTLKRHSEQRKVAKLSKEQAETDRFIRHQLSWRNGAFYSIWRDTSGKLSFTSEITILLWKYETFSLGLSDITREEIIPPDNTLLTPDSKRRYAEQMKKRQSEMNAIERIWNSSNALNGLRLSNNGGYMTPLDETQESITKLGKALGVDIMIAAYYEGVPVEHIIAD